MVNEVEAYLRGEAPKHAARWNWNGEHLLISADRPIVDATGRQNYEITSVMLEPDEAKELLNSLMAYHLIEAEDDENEDETDAMRMLDKMSGADRELISLLPHDVMHMYCAFWMNRPDAHASHRDTLPAFMAGLFAGMRR